MIGDFNIAWFRVSPSSLFVMAFIPLWSPLDLILSLFLISLISCLCSGVLLAVLWLILLEGVTELKDTVCDDMYAQFDVFIWEINK